MHMMACEVKYYFGWGIVHYISIFEIPSLQYLYSIVFTYGPNRSFCFGCERRRFFSR